MSAALSEVLQAIGNPKISESGGGHNNKGIEYQKNWAIVKMIALRQEGAGDFLFLFEAVQDVAILDSTTSPTTIDIYQVKKKDRNEWKWSALTMLHQPADPAETTPAGKPKAKKIKQKPLEDFADSPIGKLFGAISAFTTLKSSGTFVSNAGCDLELEGGGNAATSLPVELSSLPPQYRDLLQSALDKVHGTSSQKIELSAMRVEKAELAVEDPQTHAIGIASAFLSALSPKHAGQASSFVMALLAKLGPLCSKTAKAKTLDKMASRHGFSYHEFNAALADLEQLPDVDKLLDDWLNKLINESFDFMDITRIRLESAAIQRRILTGTSLPHEPSIKASCDAWLAANGMFYPLKSFIGDGLQHLKAVFPRIKDTELQAHLLLRAIQKCVDPN
ncbi:DUF4297 domain-containing protein [Rhizobium laguerreae]|uniref:dsDNA nuclease domain-containing protein n=1 Tax=Rhizobium laguerreae TaxID=1076926 RepID=UPI001C8FDA13|nr:dsDNA nuclease domain-containing protein [Rhizobium laguerreae]MBY3181410.1 DUF4297 domain-containing protein [Rhizobium laguerreae]